MSSPNPLIELIANTQFNPAGDLSEWQFAGAIPVPTLSAYWNSSTLLPANGSSGNIPFPTVGGYTPAAYTAPATNAPPGNAAFTGYATSSVTFAQYQLPPLKAGTQITVSFSYAGNPSATSLTWLFSCFIPSVAPGSSAGGVSPVTFQIFNPANGWLKFTTTFIVDADNPAAQLVITGGGTNGAVTYGQFGITGGTQFAPLLIGNLTVTYQSTGARANPPSALPVGQTLGTVMSGSDARVPRIDAASLLRPRVEVREIEVATNAAIGVGLIVPTKTVIVGSRGAFITQIAYSAEYMGSSASAIFDFTVNSVSIYPVLSQAQLPAVLGNLVGSQSSVTVPGYISPMNFPLGANSQNVLGAHVVAVSGTIQNPIITVWIYHL